MRTGAWSAQAFASMARPTTGSAKLSTFGIPTTMAWSSTGTVRPEQWPRTPGGDLAMYTAPLDLAGLRAELE